MRIRPPLLLLLLTACGSDPEPAGPEQELSDLAWSLKTHLDVKQTCRAMNASVAKWEAKHAQRFKALTTEVKTLSGGYASNFRRMESELKRAADLCIHPKQPLPPVVEHGPAIKRVFGLLPKTEQRFKLQ